MFEPNPSTCHQEPYAFRPMYATSSEHTRVPWAAHSYNVAFSDEIGHFEYCTTVSEEGGECLANNEDELDGDDVGCFSAAFSLFVPIGSTRPVPRRRTRATAGTGSGSSAGNTPRARPTRSAGTRRRSSGRRCSASTRTRTQRSGCGRTTSGTSSALTLARLAERPRGSDRRAPSGALFASR
jgi:hypothetical protein